MYKIVFIGSNPSQKSSSILPFWYDARSTKVLSQWIEQVVMQHDGIVLESVHYLNVANFTTPNNRPLTKAEIKNSLQALGYRVYGFNGVNPDKIVTLGKTAETACTMLGFEFFAMPHPSGLNRKLNDKVYLAEKINGLKEYLRCPTVIDVVDL